MPIMQVGPVPIRPVKCLLCHKQMFYKNDFGWEPEHRIDISDDGKTGDYYYVHRRCWDAFIEQKNVELKVLGAVPSEH